MEGKLLPFRDDTVIKDDAMLTCVLRVNVQYDEHCEVILSVMLPVFKKLFTGHQLGGKYSNPSEALLAQTK